MNTYAIGELPVTLPSGSRPPEQRRLLIVDGDERAARLYSRLFTEDGYTVAVAPDGPTAITMIAADPPDALVLDVGLPGYDGLEMCRRLKRETATRLTPVVLLAGLEGADRRLEALEAGVDEFLTKPVDTDMLLVRVRALVRLKRYTDDLDSAASIIETLAVMIEARDGNTEGHCYRMANYATALGRRIGLGSEELQALHRGGFLHDIGMLAIPDAGTAQIWPARTRGVPTDQGPHRDWRIAVREPQIVASGATDRPPPSRTSGRLWLPGRACW